MIDRIAKYLNSQRYLKKAPTAPVLFLEIITGLLLSLSSLLIFAKIASEVFEKETHTFDVVLSQAVYALRTPILTDVMLFISFLGADFIVVVGSIMAIVLAWKKHRHEAILFVSVLGMGGLLNIIMKTLYARPRPDFAPLLDLSSTYSFPSGHSMNSFIFYALIAYFVYHFTKKKRLSIVVASLAVLVIFLIGFSRVYLGVHYPTDVLAGFIAGFFVFMTAIVLDRTIQFFRLKRK